MSTTIFLGAGASASEGAPVQSNLFREYFKYLRDHDFEIYQNMNREIASYFSLMFRIDVDNDDLNNTKFPTFEEALGIIDLGISRGESFKHFDLDNIAANGNRLRQIRVYLILLMAKILKEKLYVENVHHTNLVNNLNRLELLEHTNFISTNYDILIDNALTNLNPRNIDYGVFFTNYYRERNWPRPNRNATKLYKVHGSLNWLYCPSCNTLTYTPYEKGIVRLVDDFSSCSCPTCESVIIPIIVPPTYFKDMSNIFLNEIWCKSEQLLRRTDHLIICGYSFPDADIHIKYLLKRIQTNKEFRIRFTVINKHDRKSQEVIDEEKKRYARFLGTDVNYTELSFEEFSQEPDVIINAI